ncbi:helix-turn-helix domain-containing protein [Serratia sp. D1N4]
MKKYKVMLSSNCQFTLAGLEYVISSDPSLSAKTDVVSWPVNWLNDSECVGFGIDILILVLDPTVNHMVTQLNSSISRWKGVNMVLLTPFNYPDGVSNYLSQMMNVRAVYSPTVSVIRLQNKLMDILEHRIPDQMKKIMKLSPQERVVIRSLLMGKSTSLIACELKLNYKTISSHKRTALMKFGIRSLHGLMMLGLHNCTIESGRNVY